MSVPRNHLSGRTRFQFQFFTDERFDRRIQVSVSSDRTRKFADRNLVASSHQSLLCPTKFVMQKGHPDSVTRWLGMDSMGPPDRQHPSMFAGPHGGCGFYFSHSRNQEIGRIPQLPSQRGVENIGGGQSLMNPTPSRANVGRHIFQERQNIVPRPLFVFVNLPYIELRFAPNRPGIFSGNDSPIRHRFTRKDLDLQPA
jgi:hypothetical protein